MKYKGIFKARELYFPLKTQIYQSITEQYLSVWDHCEVRCEERVRSQTT